MQMNGGETKMIQSRDEPPALSPQDELGIRELVVRYHDAVSRRDVTAWESTWASDGRWDVGTRSLDGRRAIVDVWQALLPGYEAVLQLPAQGWVGRRADGVVGRWLVMEILRRPGAEVDNLQVACYVDRYVQEESRWVFAHRTLTVHYRNELATGTFVPLPALP
jgi:hypothetical protein